MSCPNHFFNIHRLLLCADKLANIRDLLSEYKILGDSVFTKFIAPSKEDQKWYYESMLEALGTKESSDISQRRVFLSFRIMFSSSSGL